jgi:hypothetical protein
MNTTAWMIATPTVTTTRALSTVDAGTGASRILRSTCFLRQLTSVSAAPNTAVTATPQDMMPGVMYWIGLSEASSTFAESMTNRGACPVACWFTALTTPVTMPDTTPACVWSLCANR